MQYLMNFKIAFFVQYPFFKGIISTRLLNKFISFGYPLSACKVGVFCNLAKPHIQLASAVKLINGSERLEECFLCYFFGDMLIAC